MTDMQGNMELTAIESLSKQLKQALKRIDELEKEKREAEIEQDWYDETDQEYTGEYDTDYDCAPPLFDN